MKTKSLLAVVLTTLTTLTLFSCSKEKGVNPSGDTEAISLAFSISTKTHTRAMEGEADITALNIRTMTIELYDVNKKIIGIGKSLSANEITAVMNPAPELGDKSRIVIDGVSKEAIYAKIYAYQKADQTADDLSKEVNNFQNGFDAVPFHAYEGSVASPFDTVTGLITINKNTVPAPGPSTDPDHVGHKIWTVEASMSAYFARFEMKGAVTASDIEPIAGGAAKPWATIAVTGIYINNIKDKVTDANPTLIKGNHQNWGSGDWDTGHPYTTSGNWSKMFDVNTGEEAHSITNTALFADVNALKIAAYQIFPQGTINSATYDTDKAPHIIVRMLITPDKAVVNQNPYYAFITLRKFKVYTGIGDATATNNYLNLVERGKVYHINLGTLAPLAPGDPDPDPESGTADLYVKITIENWTDVYLRPEL